MGGWVGRRDGEWMMQEGGCEGGVEVGEAGMMGGDREGEVVYVEGGEVGAGGERIAQ